MTFSARYRAADWQIAIGIRDYEFSTKSDLLKLKLCLLLEVPISQTFCADVRYAITELAGSREPLCCRKTQT